MTKNWITATLAAITVGLAPSLSLAQTQPRQLAPNQPPETEAVVYKPPVRGVPGGRVGGATRGTVKPATPLPTIDIIAPDGHSGLTTSAAPTLYFYVSRRVTYPTRLTISAPGQPAPIIETNIPSPQAAGIYAIRLGDYRVRLDPGVVYSWSVSVILNPNAPSRDIVASASLLRIPPDPNLDAAVRAASTARRAALFADAGLWYDAVAAAADLNQRGALDALMNEVGLAEPATYNLSTTGGTPLR
jgi:Domain of Unknown Function (DUF928)